MKTKISIFITVIALLFGATATFAQGTQAYFKKDGVTIFQSAISDIDSIVFKQTTTEEDCQSFDNPQGVVINGVRWATRNVGEPGTFASSPCDPGMFYQWNRITAWATTGEVTDWDSTTPTGVTWEKANDPSPAGWRVPTYDEIIKLLDTNKVDNVWTTQNGINGRKFTDKSSGNSIFLPAAGYRATNGALVYVGSSVGYWSNAQYGTDGAYNLYFGKGSAVWNASYRLGGFTIRSVADGN